MSSRIKVLVRKKPDREHLLLYYVDPQTGREKSRSADTADIDEARKAAGRWEAELEQTRGVDGCSWTWFRQRFNDEYLPRRSPHSRRVHRTALNHFERLIKVGSVADITPNHVSRFQGLLGSESVADATLHTYCSHLRAAFNWAEKIGLMRKAPHFDMPGLGKRKLMKGRPLTEREFKRMLAAVAEVRPRDTQRWRRLLELLWYSGLRLEEAMRLSWDSPPIKVVLDGKPYPHLLFWAEGHKARQDVATPIAPDFAAWLGKTPAKQRKGLVAPMLTRDGNLLAPLKVSRVYSAVGRTTKIVVDDVSGKHASAHDLRRSFGTRWAQHVRPVTLQRMMRHSNIETTLKYYIGLSAADAGAELWGSVPKFVPKKSHRTKNAGRKGAKKRGKSRS